MAFMLGFVLLQYKSDLSGLILGQQALLDFRASDSYEAEHKLPQGGILKASGPCSVVGP